MLRSSSDGFKLQLFWKFVAGKQVLAEVLKVGCTGLPGKQPGTEEYNFCDRN